MSSNTVEGFDGRLTREPRAERASFWSQIRLWTQRMSKAERYAVAATMATTFFLIGVMLVALHLTLENYVIQIGTWPA